MAPPPHQPADGSQTQPIDQPTAQPTAAHGLGAAAAAADRYTIEHETRYAYTAPVSQSWQLARLTPRNLPWQRLLSHRIQIDPPPDERVETTDGYGNAVSHFGLHGAHRQLRVRMHCQVEVGDRPTLDLRAPTTVSAVRESMRHAAGRSIDLAPPHMAEPTALVPWSAAARCYAEASLQPERPWCEALSDLMRRIHADFEFDAHATTVSTSVDDVLQQRRGVCQDFAHLMLACLRGHGLAARYVSGYLLTDPPPGMPRLLGVDASHAWVAAHLPGHGWVEFDPTNDQLADRRHITLAWGADFADVVPLRGVILGGGAAQQMDVMVSVVPER
jgi:transglutaminase-like putative cysteine protease